MALYQFPGVAFVTGAGGSGIGNAVAVAFAKSKCKKIAITDINKETLEKTKNDILEVDSTVEVFSQDGDISDENFVNSFAEEVVKRFSRIDYAANCAGINGPSLRSHETPTALFDKINGVNYRGLWFSSRAQLTQMLKQEPLPEHPGQRGAVVNIASQLGLLARPKAAPYNASKAAVINITRSDAIDYSSDGIRVNCVCPGVVNTPLTNLTPEITERAREAAKIAPMKRMGKPSEIADAVMFLCSSQASFVQGHTLVVDGGYMIN